MKRIRPALLLALALPLLAARPVPANRRLDAELTALVQAPGEELASLSVLAVRHGRVVYQGQFGQRRLGEPARPAQPGTLYRMASISKLVTTLGVMKLVEQGRLDLDRDIAVDLGFAVRNPHFPAVPITLRQLLSHTSSLRDDGGYYWDAASGIRLNDVLTPGGRAYGEGRMWAAEAAPGARFQYCNLAWGVIGTVMEKVTGERFDRLMRRLILDPMGLPGGWNPADLAPAELDQVATLYRKRTTVDGKDIWDSRGPWIAQTDDFGHEAPVSRAPAEYQPGGNGTLFGPQGNCRLSAASLGRIMQMLMAGGSSQGKRILRRSSVAEMLKRQWQADGTDAAETAFGSQRQFMNAWGLGVQHFLDISGAGAGDRIVEGGGFRALGHMGEAWGLTSGLLFDPKTRNGLIFLVSGNAADPDTRPGRYSGFHRHEEQIMTALYRRAILGDPGR